MPKKNKKLNLKLGIQILTNDDGICIPRLFSILLAVTKPPRQNVGFYHLE